MYFKSKAKETTRTNFDLENIGQPDYFSIAVDADQVGIQNNGIQV